MGPWILLIPFTIVTQFDIWVDTDVVYGNATMMLLDHVALL